MQKLIIITERVNQSVMVGLGIWKEWATGGLYRRKGSKERASEAKTQTWRRSNGFAECRGRELMKDGLE